ncbi:MAG: MarR family transcriptional regulator [Nanoarchaeota archaeon]|nr:MarR family transcriptional regulator [Nanoarchaeota archaeon]
MIDFACKSFKIDEVIKCSLGLSKSDFAVVKLMLKNGDRWFNTSDLAEGMHLNLTTVQRSVKKLHEKDIIERTQNNLDNGGYLFFYRFKDKRLFSKKIHEIITSWVRKVDSELENL